MPPKLNPALAEVWRPPARNRVIYGGRASSKSWDAAGMAIYIAQACRVRVLCTRHFQNKIADSVYTLLKTTIDRFGLGHAFTVLDNAIRCDATGSEFVFYGRARNLDEIKSLEGIDIHWAEEAHMMTREQWDIIDPTLRGEASQHWVVFNPRLVTDFVWRFFVLDPPPRTVVRKINYDENPYLSDNMRQVIEHMRATDYEHYRHIYEGEPLADDDKAIIQRSWLLAAVDAHKALGITPSGVRRIGYDVADDGGDANATVTAHGCLAYAVDEWHAVEDELLQSCSRVYDKARGEQARIYYDNIGVGAGAGAKFAELNRASGARVRHDGFGAGNGVERPDDEDEKGTRNRDNFANLKAQAWYVLAARLRDTYAAVTRGQHIDPARLVSISSEIPEALRLRLFDELAAPHRKYDAAGRKIVESKADMAKRGVKSPNMADAFVMAYSPLIEQAIDYGALL